MSILNMLKTLETFFVFKVSVLYSPRFMKTEILNNATQLFLNQGFKSVTMDDIATHMGISKKTIYANYAHKTELVEAVGHHLLNNVQCAVKDMVDEHMNPIEELYEIKSM